MATIGADNQMAIQATGSIKGVLGYHLVDRFHEQLMAVQHKNVGLRIELRWTSGHKGIPEEKEHAEAEAKKVACRGGDCE